MTPDMINGIFELVGAFLVANHCRVTLRDRSVKGVSILSTFIFTLWGAWNCVYYPLLDQWYSFAGSILLLAVNALWVALMIIFRMRESKCQK